MGDPWFKRLVRTDDDIAPFLVRLFLGIVMFPHGAQKMLGWFGGPGFDDALMFLTQKAHLPAAIALLVIVFEFFGSLGLIFGFFGRLSAFGILCVMAGAVLTVHLPNGFFMNWTGTQPGEGYEYHLLAIGMALTVIVKGSGRFSLDRSLTLSAERAEAEVEAEAPLEEP